MISFKAKRERENKKEITVPCDRNREFSTSRIHMSKRIYFTGHCSTNLLVIQPFLAFARDPYSFATLAAAVFGMI